MGADAVLEPVRVPVAPGGEAQAEIAVRNNGLVVDSFALQVLGDAAGWMACDPAVLSLMPGQHARARVVVRPPAGAGVPFGPVPFAVRVISKEDPPGSVVEEGVLDVGELAAVGVDLSPRTGRARGLGASRHRVAVDNRGNLPAVVGLVGSDEADTVDVQVRPADVEVGPGSAAFAEVRVRARRRFWRGPGVTHRFAVTAMPPGGAPVRSEGAVLQEAVLPSWLPKAVALVLLGAAAAAALWFGLVRPAVKDAATSAGTAAAQQAVNKAIQSAAASPGGAGHGGAGNSPSPQASGGAGGKASKPPVALPAPVPFAQTLNAANPSLTAAPKHSLSLTDLVMQNPAGDQGTLTVSRAGQTLLSEQLANFRDYDLHFITAIDINAGDSLTVSVSCKNPGGKACTPVVLISGMNNTTAF